MTLGSEKNALLEALHCSSCKEYMSSAPILTLPNGFSVCNQCVPLSKKPITVRTLALENFARAVQFPCRFKENGCNKSLRFNRVQDHESVCAYRTGTCPFASVLCTWEGSVSEMSNHIKTSHSEYILGDNNIEIDIRQSSGGVFLLVQNCVDFIVKYSYDCSNGNLYYNIRYFDNRVKHIDSIVYKIKLINASNTEHSLGLKTSSCLKYDHNFVNLDVEKYPILCLKKFLYFLHSPSHILVSFIIKITFETSTVDYKLLDLIKCYKCGQYLVPPVYDIDNGTICSDCAKMNVNAALSINSKVDELMAIANYPCRWNKCTFVGNSRNIKQHEMHCDFIILRCTMIDCASVFKVAEFQDHFKNYHFVEMCFSNEITYEATFTNNWKYTTILTYIDEKHVIINRKTIDADDDIDDRYHSVTIIPVEPGLNISWTIVFTHEHCKLNSNTFVGDAEEPMKFAIGDLPKCFKPNESFTVTINLEIITDD